MSSDSMLVEVNILMPGSADVHHYRHAVDANMAKKFMHIKRPITPGDHMAMSEETFKRDQARVFAQHVGTMIALSMLAAIAEKGNG
jgi:hypothetical protein